MNPPSRSRLVVDWVVVLALAGVFLFASIEKIRDPVSFTSSVRNYKFLPFVSTNLFALFLPWWELLAAIAVLVPSARWRRAGALLTLGMGIMFVIAVVRGLILGLDISCGCFGHAGSAKIGLETLAIDTGVIVASIYVLRMTFRAPQQPPGFAVITPAAH